MTATLHYRPMAGPDPPLGKMRYWTWTLRAADIYATVTNYRQHCEKRNAPVFNLLRGRFWGFSPCRGDTLVPSSMPNFTPQSVQRLGYRSPKTDIFTDIWSKCGI